MVIFEIHNSNTTQTYAFQGRRCLARFYIPQRGVQWKQGVVTCTMLYTSLLCNTTPIHCTPLPLHPPLMNTHRCPRCRTMSHLLVAGLYYIARCSSAWYCMISRAHDIIHINIHSRSVDTIRIILSHESGTGLIPSSYSSSLMASPPRTSLMGVRQFMICTPSPPTKSFPTKSP